MLVKNCPSDQEIFQKVQKLLAEALGVDEEEVTYTSRIYADLGAESIDRLDITFRAERMWRIKINPGEMTAESIIDEPDCVKNGLVTDLGMKKMRKKFRHIKGLDAFETHRKVEELQDLFTVENLCRFVKSKLTK